MSAIQPPAGAVEAVVRAVKAQRKDKPGYYLIQHPNTPMIPEQRAWEMWAVHPSDLDGFDMTREAFFLAHIRAAIATLRPAIIAQERAATVAWMRTRKMTFARPTRNAQLALTSAAYRIERGDHEQKGPSRGEVGGSPGG